ncbi:MAG: lipase family protein [Paraglaciecola chathamensis]
MYKVPLALSKGIHVIALPLNASLPIDKVFPREISGSYIEKMDKTGKFTNKSQIFYESGLFLVNKVFHTLEPMQIVRLHLTRDITLFWDVNIHFQSHTRLRKEVLPYASGYCKERALHLMQLCKLVYEDETMIREILDNRYSFSDIYYFSKTTAYKQLIKGKHLNLLYLFIKSHTTIVDLQFMKLIRYDEKQDKHIILLVFKGSKEVEDWVTNLSSSGVDFLGNTNSKVHKGFQEALQLFIATIKESFFELNGESYSLDDAVLPLLNSNTKIVFTGHSLGGAIATLAACYFHDRGYKSENIEVYTFGAPPIASRAFVDHFRGKFSVYRVVNRMDIIPRLESINPNLFHLGEKIVLPSNNNEVHAPSDYIDNLLDALGEGSA